MADKELTINKGSDPAVTEERNVANWLTPAVDIFEDEESITLITDLPGVAKDGLHLGIEKGVLTIEAIGKAGEEGNPLFREFGNSGYYRRFQLPDSLEFDKVEANMKDGVLNLRLPKTAAARPRRIEVTVH